MGDTGRRFDRVAEVVTADADGTYGAPEAALLNEIKASLNALIATLKNAGLMER